jgi:predicted PurR-regulated permease PerM
LAVTLESPSQTERTRDAVRGYIVFAFALLLTLALAWQLRKVLEIIYVSALFAVVLMPVVHSIMQFRFGKYRPSRTVAIFGLALTVFLALFLFLWIGLPPVIHNLRDFATDLPARIPGIVARVKKVPIAEKIGVDQMAVRAEAMASSFAGYVVTSLPLWASHLLDIVTAFILCVYFMLEGDTAYAYFLTFLKPVPRARLKATLDTAEQRMSKWLIGQGALMLILGVSSTIVFGILHVRYFFMLGVLMGLFNLVPVAGGVITILLAAGVAALDSWSKMAGVLIFYAVYAQLENAVLTPRIMKSSVDLMGLSVLIALMVGLALAGIVGALVSVPTAALVAVLMDEYLVQKPPSPMVPTDAAS